MTVPNSPKSTQYQAATVLDQDDQLLSIGEAKLSFELDHILFAPTDESNWGEIQTRAAILIMADEKIPIRYRSQCKTSHVGTDRSHFHFEIVD